MRFIFSFWLSTVLAVEGTPKVGRCSISSKHRCRSPRDCPGICVKPAGATDKPCTKGRKIRKLCPADHPKYCFKRVHCFAGYKCEFNEECMVPTHKPSVQPSATPSVAHTDVPIDVPSTNTLQPSGIPSMDLSSLPSSKPSSSKTTGEPLTDAKINGAVNAYVSGGDAAVELKYGTIDSWDVSRVTNMRDLFFDKKTFNADLSKWDTSSVTDMKGMFYGTAFNGNLSSWNTSSVTNIHIMFDWATAFNGNISSWDTSSVTNMDGMLANTLFNGDLSSWDISSVKSMKYMFYNAAKFDVELCWTLPTGVDTTGMFQSCPGRIGCK